MKNISPLYLVSILLVAGLLSLPLSCGNNASTPTIPSYSFPTPSAAPTQFAGAGCPANGLCVVASVSRSTVLGTSTLAIQAWLQTSGSSAVTNAGVTLTTPGGPVPVPYFYSYCFGNTCWALYQQSAQSWTYTPGQTYTLQVSTSSNYSIGCIAPGNITNAANGNQSSWTVEGNEDQVYVLNAQGVSVFYVGPLPDANSPVNIPASIYAQPGNYTLVTGCSQVCQSLSTNTALNLALTDDLGSIIAGSPTLTPTLAPPTVTFTPTPTQSPVATNTPTATPVHTFVTSWTTMNGILFNNPEWVAVDSTDNIYVSDMGNNRVVKFTNAGTYSASITGTGSNALSSPSGLVVDPSNNVFVVDQLNYRVEEFTSTGAFVRKWGSIGAANGQFKTSNGIALNSSATTIYVVDSANFRVQMFTTIGGYAGQWGTQGSGTGQFQNPFGVALDASNNVYVTDGNLSTVQKFNSAGTYQSQWTVQGSSPFPVGIMAYNSQFLVTANALNMVEIFDSTGGYVNQWGGNSQFSYPDGIAHDSGGYIYVADSLNNCVDKFAP